MLADLRFPEDLEEETCDLVAGLLVPKPEQRFGCGPLGLEDVKACPFFGPEGLDDADRAAMGEKDYFRLLLVRELHPPIPPSAPTPDARSPVSNEPEAQDNTLQFRDGPTRLPLLPPPMLPQLTCCSRHLFCSCYRYCCS